MVQQTVLVAARYPSVCAPLTRTIAFDDIESIYLDVWEDSCTVEQPADEDGAAETLWIRRRWMVGLQLNDGETVTLYEDVTDQPAHAIPYLGRQRSYWESLARRTSEDLDKPLMKMAPAPRGLCSFVEAIEHILQRRLERSPLAGLSVHVRGKGFGIEILVNGRAYEALADVEEESAREAIRAAVDEWQRSSR